MAIPHPLWAASAALFDILLPGDKHFPPASVALREGPALPLSEEDGRWLAAAARRVADAPAETRIERTAELEREAPEPFARVLTALTAAYYRTRCVQAAAIALAQHAPVEADPVFDETLLDRVRATRAGAARRI
ncbi:hypothetical protein [Acuticoccus sediminis]|uniref:hypothetical protein n=1 Tax=Acuticoccus sediminis TaxID=2184697 RepID=UPI001CFCCEE3|nr:hypothetical protein [Acuticoccus sediminis]